MDAVLKAVLKLARKHEVQRWHTICDCSLGTICDCIWGLIVCSSPPHRQYAEPSGSSICRDIMALLPSA